MRDTVSFIEVLNHNAETLLPLIEEYVLQGTRIISDGWRAYDEITQLPQGVYMQLRMIIYAENFVNPVNPEVNTQNIENFLKSCEATV